MYCTNCGASEQSSKTYCRHCGKWIGGSPPDDRLTVMIIFNGLSALFGAVSAIALFVTYLGRPSAKWSVYLAATFCLIISVYQSLSFLFALNMKRRLKEGQSNNTARLNAVRDTNELRSGDSSDFISVSSVTEQTTELLERKSR